jgi:hypothetical protein
MPLSGGFTHIGTPIITMNGAPPPDTGPSFTDSVTEAEARPLDFPATERASYLRDTIATIQAKQAAGVSPAAIKAEFAEFIQGFPRLFETIMEPNYDKATLQTMLAMLDRMGQGSLSPHQASVIVGQRLLEKARK